MYVGCVGCVGDWLVGWLLELEFSVLSRRSTCSSHGMYMDRYSPSHIYIKEKKTIACAHPIRGRLDEREEQQESMEIGRCSCFVLNIRSIELYEMPTRGAICLKTRQTETVRGLLVRILNN